jgi:hypothetical protein
MVQLWNRAVPLFEEGLKGIDSAALPDQSPSEMLDCFLTELQLGSHRGNRCIPLMKCGTNNLGAGVAERLALQLMVLLCSQPLFFLPTDGDEPRDVLGVLLHRSAVGVAILLQRWCARMEFGDAVEFEEGGVLHYSLLPYVRIKDRNIWIRNMKNLHAWNSGRVCYPGCEPERGHVHLG